MVVVRVDFGERSYKLDMDAMPLASENWLVTRFYQALLEFHSDCFRRDREIAVLRRALYELSARMPEHSHWIREQLDEARG